MLSPLIQLRAEVAARTPGWRNGASARRQLTQELLRGLSREGCLEIHARGNRLMGFVLSWWEARSWTGGALQRVIVEVEPDCAVAADWATRRILELGSDLDGPLDLRVNAEQHILRARLIESGLGVDSVTMVGSPGPALVMLQARWNPPRNLGHLGLTIVPLAPHHVDAALALHRRVFLAAPEFCWFGAMPDHLMRLRREFQRSGPDTRHRVVLWDERVVGVTSASVQFDPCWGRKAGVELVLDPSIQQKGIAKTAYLDLLDWLVESGADCVCGGTAQPAIMHLGRAMGRVPFETSHRRGVSFPRSHFDPVLGGASEARRLAPV